MYFQNISTYLLILILGLGGLAMKPAPMTENIKIQSKNGNYTLISLHEQNITEVYKNGSKAKSIWQQITQLVSRQNSNESEKQKVWKLDWYIGKQKPFLSPDGQLLVLVGDVMLGNQLTTGAYIEMGENPIYIQVIRKGTVENEIRHRQLFDMSIEKLAEVHDLPVKGGGWVSMNQLLKNYPEISESIDWKNNQITLQLINGESKTMPLLGKF